MLALAPESPIGDGYSRALRGMGGMLRGGAGALLLLSSAGVARAQSAQCANLTWSAPGDGSDVEREFAVAFALPRQAVPGSVHMVRQRRQPRMHSIFKYLSSSLAVTMLKPRH